jgi:DNA-binding response OmpR family regulator
MDSFCEVLLIDDDPVQLMVRAAVLRNAGFQIAIANTAESALSMLLVLGQRVGLIITDHVMPVCSGAEFVRQLRKENDVVSIIVLSGQPEASCEYKGLRVVFKTKPTPPAELIELVRNGLANSNLKRGAA